MLLFILRRLNITTEMTAILRVLTYMRQELSDRDVFSHIQSKFSAN